MPIDLGDKTSKRYVVVRSLSEQWAEIERDRRMNSYPDLLHRLEVLSGKIDDMQRELIAEQADEERRQIVLEIEDTPEARTEARRKFGI